MTFYQKKHDVKFFRPLILPLTQVSKNIFLILSYTSQINSCFHALNPQKTSGGDRVFSNREVKMSPLLKGTDTVYPVL